MPRSPRNTNVEFWRDDALPGIELRRSTYRERVFRDHTHPAYSIGLMDGGGASFALLGGEHRAAEGDIVVIGPYEPHACNPDPGWFLMYRMLYVTPSLMPEIAGARPIFLDPVIVDPDLFSTLSDLFDLVASEAGLDEKRASLASALEWLTVEYASADDRATPGDAQVVEVVKGLLQERYAQKVTLDEIAQAAQVSRSHLCRAFRAAQGVPPHAFQNQVRVQRAKELLRGGMTLSEVANRTGFADQSHLNRVFREYTGATPGQYQETGSRS